MSKFLLSTILSLAAWIVFTSLLASQNKRPPNVVIIFTDDQGYNDVACFGAPDIETPHLDQMAREGLTLTSFYAAQAVCSASRAGLLTGCYPNRIGIHGALMPKSLVALHHNEMTIAEVLKQRGYRSALFGKWHLGDHPDYLPTHHGFDEYYGIPYSNDMWPKHPGQGKNFHFGPLPLIEMDKAVDTLLDQSNLTVELARRSVRFIKENKNRPFFLYLAHPQPHVPLFVSQKFRGKSKRGLYGDVIMEIDWSVGQIFQALKESGIDNETMVIFTSDNGPWLSYGNHAGSAYPLREGKGTAWEGGQREPCIIRFPGKIKAGSTMNTPMMNIDVLPTVAALCDAPLPEHPIDGKNLLPLWYGQTQISPQEAYFFYYHVNELHAVRYGNWKMYFPHSYRSLNGREGGKDGIPVDYEYLKLEQIELYDLSRDLSETKNVATLYPEVILQISKLADAKRRELGDSLLKIEAEGARPPALPRWPY